MKPLNLHAARAIVGAVFAIMSLSSLAQDATNPFVGKWKVNWPGNNKILEATLDIKSNGGTWHAFSAGRYDTCGGREIPIQIKSVDVDKLALVVLYNDVIPGCKNWDIKLQSESDGKVTGKRGETALTLTRKQ